MVKEKKDITYFYNRHILKVLAFMLSLFLWVYILNSQPVEQERKVQIQYILPEGYVFKQMPVEEFTLKLRASRNLMRSALNGENQYVVNLTSAGIRRKGKRKIPIRHQELPLPIGVSVVGLRPSTIDYELDKKVVKKVNLTPALMGEVEKSYRLMKWTLQPSQINISGPKDVLKKIDSISTKPIDLSQIKGTGEFKVPLELEDPRLSFERDDSLNSQDEVTFSYDVRAKNVAVDLKRVRIRFLSSKASYIPEQRYTTLSVEVPEGVLIEEKAKDIQVIADIPEEKNGNVRVQLRVLLPENVHLLQIQPQYINVKVK